MTYTINQSMIGSDPTDAYTVTTSNNTGGTGLYWGNLNGTSTSWANITMAEPALNGATLSVKGNAEFEGEVKIGGKNIAEMFEKIEDRLAILHPNEQLEEKWEELRNLRKAYKELEAEIIEKEKVWGILKK